ncbi:neurogenic locus notch homolog protein 1-like isoform X5 [Littorina saxatilis]|uniref:neurogenic locus notch homolog protein 1-like isoform X5 n=1 Tax=Littorina saxatilis TaxID=31220 RepID=UPI0038B5689E
MTGTRDVVFLALVVISLYRVDGANTRGRLSVEGSSTDPLPTRLSVALEMGDGTLDLILDSTMDINFPLYRLQTDNRGRFHIKTAISQTTFKVYQDIKKDAAFIFVTETDDEGSTTQSLEGMVHREGRMLHVKGDVTRDGAQGRAFPGHQDLDFEVQDMELNATEFWNDYNLPVSDLEAGVFLAAYDSTAKEKESTKYHHQKRNLNQDVFVDIVAFADYGVYSAWFKRSNKTTAEGKRKDALEKIKQYYALVFNEMDLMYKSLTSLPFTVHIRLVGIIIADTDSASPWTEALRIAVDGKRVDEVDGYQALPNISSWLRTSDIVPHNDHFMFFTGYDLTKPVGNSTSGTLAGRAYVGTTCRNDGSQTSIVEDLGNFGCTFVGAHELGHSLSAQHDGDNNHCMGADGYIMSPIGSNKLNAWVFSNCSADYFQQFVTERREQIEGEMCLLNPITPSEIPDVTSQMPGQIYEADEQCRRIYGPDSSVAPCQSLMDGLKDVCTKMFCFIGDRKCKRQKAARGTTCGVDKWCISGECVLKNQSINECASNPCLNSGTCIDEIVYFSCTCPEGYTGTRCETNINDCASNPCLNSGTCRDGIGNYSCTCPSGYTGNRCQINVNDCASNPCLNNGTCRNGIGNYSCTCPSGYTGNRCQIDINDCASNPCFNSGTCRDGIGNYSCTCPSGYTGNRCQTDIDECATNPCLNGGLCRDGTGNYSCICGLGYTGNRCQILTNNCASNPCLNSGTCRNGIGNYSCTCPSGYTGNRCQTVTNNCASNPCLNSGTCRNGIGNYSCTCPSGYTGNRCQTDIDECATNPCLNGGLCRDGTGNYSCICGLGYTGNRCQILTNNCASNPCLNSGTCRNGIGNYSCTCPSGYTGNRCQTVTNNCASNPCLNRATCWNGIGNYSCSCPSGYTGNRCQIVTNNCASNPCLNSGTCRNGIGNYSCTCPSGYTGNRCQTVTNNCASNPCLNSGTCRNGIGNYSCTCPSGYTGNRCQIDIDECATNPCLNGGLCRDGTGNYSCICGLGYTGNLCQILTNNCASNPCLNSGTCRNGIGNYSCSCPSGYTGNRCQTDTNECSSNPCLNGGSCSDRTGSYVCTCRDGYTGSRCQIDINECARKPCKNGGTCHNLRGRYTCSCRRGFSGRNCLTNINECARKPCKNGGTCHNLRGRYTCSCRRGFSGRNCLTAVNECASNPCLNGGTCLDAHDLFTCTCPSQFVGPRCESRVSTPTTKGSIRLVNGSHPREGRVEIFLHGRWGTVCDDSWSARDVRVACRQLGYSGSLIRVYTRGHFGVGQESTVLLDDVHCLGHEARLLDCPAKTTGISCGQGEIAGLSCDVGRPGVSTPTINGSIRLVNGSHPREGRVEIFLHGRWGTVCDDSWSARDVRVACRQLGYSGSLIRVYTRGHFGVGQESTVLLDDVHCLGHEARLLDCPAKTTGISCGQGEIAGLSCDVGRPGVSTPTINGSIRLVNGSHPREGRVEIFLHGRWGTVCDDSWSARDVRVACRQLGYSGSLIRVYTRGHFGVGQESTVLLDDVHCLGHEARLLDCPAKTTGISCGQGEIAGLSCNVGRPAE